MDQLNDILFPSYPRQVPYTSRSSLYITSRDRSLGCPTSARTLIHNASLFLDTLTMLNTTKLIL